MEGNSTLGPEANLRLTKFSNHRRILDHEQRSTVKAKNLTTIAFQKVRSAYFSNYLFGKNWLRD